MLYCRPQKTGQKRGTGPGAGNLAWAQAQGKAHAVVSGLRKILSRRASRPGDGLGGMRLIRMRPTMTRRMSWRSLLLLCQPSGVSFALCPRISLGYFCVEDWKPCVNKWGPRSVRGMWLPIPFPPWSGTSSPSSTLITRPSTVREMRTLALALDLILGGRVGLAGDLFIQRLKALYMSPEMAMGDTAAPEDLLGGGASLRETEFARSMAGSHGKGGGPLGKGSF